MRKSDSAEVAAVAIPVFVVVIALLIGMIEVWGFENTPACTNGSAAALFTDCTR